MSPGSSLWHQDFLLPQKESGAIGGIRDEKKMVKAAGGLEDTSVLCKLRHLNEEYYRQHSGLKHPEKKGKSKVNSVHDVAIESSDKTSKEKRVLVGKLARVASVSPNKIPLLYDTGASHHFVRCEKDFVRMNKLRKPFRFDQAVGKSTLTHQGVSRVTIGDQTLDLEESLFSPNSTCNIISAGWLKEQHGIVAAQLNELLVRMKDNRSCS